jgi:predicted dehydrogenase
VPDRVRIGVVGLGAVAQAVHLPLLDRLSDHFMIASVADLSAGLTAAIGERYRVPAARRHPGLADLLGDDDLDGLVILTSGSHGEAVLAGLDRGLDVFVEKPLAFTLAEADAVRDRLGRPGARRLQVGYMKLYDPAVVEGLAVAAEPGRTGPIRSVEACVLHPTGERQLAHARLLPPPADVPAATIASLREAEAVLLATALGPAAGTLGPLYANVVLGSIVHELAIIRAFAGDPTAIDAVDVWPAGQWPPSVAITGRLEDDARISIRWHFLPDYAAYREEVRFVAERATIELEFPSPYLLHAPTRLRITERHGTARHDTHGLSVTEAFEEELLAFHAMVVDGQPPKAGVVEGRADIVTSQRIVARYAESIGQAIRTEARG